MNISYFLPSFLTDVKCAVGFVSVLQIRILFDIPDQDSLVRGKDPDTASDPDPSIINKK
jgi:hypothetical protein